MPKRRATKAVDFPCRSWDVMTTKKRRLKIVSGRGDACKEGESGKDNRYSTLQLNPGYHDLVPKRQFLRGDWKMRTVAGRGTNAGKPLVTAASPEPIEHEAHVPDHFIHDAVREKQALTWQTYLYSEAFFCNIPAGFRQSSPARHSSNGR